MNQELRKAELDTELSNKELSRAFDHLHEKTRSQVNRFHQIINRFGDARNYYNPKNNRAVAWSSLALVGFSVGTLVRRLYLRFNSEEESIFFESGESGVESEQLF